MAVIFFLSLSFLSVILDSEDEERRAKEKETFLLMPILAVHGHCGRE